MSCYFEPLATLVLFNLWSESFYYTHISQTQILSGSCMWFCDFLLYLEVLPSCVLCCFFVLPFFCIHLSLVCVYSLCAPSCFYQFVLCDSPVCSPATRRVCSWCFMFFVSRVIPWVFPDLIHAFCGTLMELSCHYLVFWGFTLLVGFCIYGFGIIQLVLQSSPLVCHPVCIPVCSCIWVLTYF